MWEDPIAEDTRLWLSDRETNLKLTRKLPPCWLALTVPEGVVSAGWKEKNSMNLTLNTEILISQARCACGQQDKCACCQTW